MGVDGSHNEGTKRSQVKNNLGLILSKKNMNWHLLFIIFEKNLQASNTQLEIQKRHNKKRSVKAQLGHDQYHYI